MGVLLLVGYVSVGTFGMRASKIDYFASTVSKSLTLENCGESRKYLIIGGIAASDGMYPWMVSLQLLDGGQFRHHCGATILNKRWIITAAHCFEGPDSTSDFRLVAGINEISESDDPSTNIYSLLRIITHPNFDTNTVENDIALIETSEPIAIENDLIGGICLPDDFDEPTGPATVIGWGHQQWNKGEDSEVLMEVEVPLVDRSECKKHYPEIITETHICAGAVNKDACQGDSGGPLFETIDGISTLIGIVSFGEKCGVKPGVYAKVSSYLEWMKENIH